MLTLLEVQEPSGNPENPYALVARLDVTENTEAEQAQALADLKTLYGAGYQYYRHSCYHDYGDKPCLVVTA